MTPITRKQFLEISSLSAAALALSSYDSINEDTLTIGLCGSWEKSALAKPAGCSYIEESVVKFLMPQKSTEEFEQQLRNGSSNNLPVACCNLFLPAELKIVGDHPRHEEIINYASIAFKRARQVGAGIIVFGSSGARSIPDGFDHVKAQEQFISLCLSIAPLAADHSITLGVEALNKGETNFINTLHEAAEIVDAVNHPNLKMICDIYHALKENDPAEELVHFSKYLVHCHIAEKEERTPPGVKGDDFTSYFKALKKIKYSGRISLECNWKNMEEELPLAVRTLQEQFARA